MDFKDGQPIIENCLLIRESLSDKGHVLNINASPDIIVQRYPLSDPLRRLTETYNVDISENKIQARTMYVYVRFKNISTIPLENFYIHVYRNHLGLINNPKEWNKYRLATIDGKPSRISRLEANAIGASKAFLFGDSKEGIYPNCLIAVATYEENPDFSYIDSYQKYIIFMYQKNVAARNVCEIITNTTYTEQKLYFRTSGSKESVYYFIAEVSKNTTPGVIYGLKCTDPLFSEYMSYDPNGKGTLVVKTVLSGNREYEVTLWAEIPKGGKVDVTVKMLIEAVGNGLMDYAVDIRDLLKDKDACSKAAVVTLGDCRVKIDRTKA